MPTKQKKEKAEPKKKSKKRRKRIIKDEDDEMKADFEEEFSDNDVKCGSENEKSPGFENGADG